MNFVEVVGKFKLLRMKLGCETRDLQG